VGRHAGTVTESNGHHEHEQLCVGRSMPLAFQKHDFDRHLGRCSPFFELHDEKYNLSRSFLK
jgi:hypothetical protein